MNEQDFIGELMSFNPQDLSAFQEPEKKTYDKNIYKTNPVTNKVVSEDGHYRSLVKILYNPFNVKKSIISQSQYVLNDEQGLFLVKSSLSIGDRNCPIFKGWKSLWFSGDDVKKQYAREMFDKTESQWVLVQVIEDNNQPELVGKFMAMKLPKTVFEKMTAKMNPVPESKKSPVPLMDYIIGPVLEMDVTPGPNDPAQPSRRQREISYSLCDFATEPTPIIKTDGTPFFTDEEMDLIESYNTARQNYEKAKSEAKKQQFKAEIDNIITTIKDLYNKALSYIKDNAIDIEKECGYQPWSPELTARVERWLDAVTNMKNPRLGNVKTQGDFEKGSVEVTGVDATADDFMPF